MIPSSHEAMKDRRRGIAGGGDEKQIVLQKCSSEEKK